MSPPLDWLGEMSDVLIEFARPVLDGLPGSLDSRVFQTVMQFAAVAWNVGLIANSTSDREFDAALANVEKMCAEFPEADREDCRALMLEMIQRRLTLFADDPRFIISLEAFREGRWLRVDASYGVR